MTPTYPTPSARRVGRMFEANILICARTNAGRLHTVWAPG